MRRRQLGMELRRLREAAEKTIEEVAGHIDRAQSTVSRIETGKTGARPVLVRAMLDLYGVPEGPEREVLLALAKDAQRKGWWNEYDDVISADFERYLGYEGGAAGLRAYDNRAVPGLLQTPDYARACFRAGLVYDPDEVERRVELRLKRQELLDRTDPLALWAIFDEAVLRRGTGDPETTRAQLKHLARMSRRPNVDIQVLPFGRGLHAGLDGPFTVIEFAEPTDPDVVHIEGPAGNIYLEKARDVRRHVSAFNHLVSQALTPVESIRFVKAMTEEIG